MFNIFKRKQKINHKISVDDFYEREYNQDINKNGYKDFFGNGFTLENDEVRIVDFRSSVKVGTEEVKKWQKEIIDFLIKNPESKYTTMMSGNAIVIGFRKLDGCIEIIEVTNGFREWLYKKPADLDL